MSKRRVSRRDPEQIAFARVQRQQANEFSQSVWEMVRSGRLLGEKFRREYALGPYTLDFVCIDLKLNIEIDGRNHLTEEGKRYDARRDAYLRKRGFEVLRINGFRVTQEPMKVKDEIEAVVSRLRAATPHPRPLSPMRGEGRQRNNGSRSDRRPKSK
jgi:very-short-patch-repair endonuclease